MTVPHVIGIYRALNAPHVLRLLAPVLQAGWTTAWWALDEIAPSLERWTVGVGAGLRFPVLNEILSRAPEARGAVVITDDDVEFVAGDLVRLAAIANQAGLGVAQPSHAPGSNLSFAFTRARRFSRSRLTKFVESGPVVFVDQAWVSRVFPLDEKWGMGWGVELDWAALRREGCRLGIVDAVSIRHLGVIAAEYGAEDEAAAREQLQAGFAAHGLVGWEDLLHELGIWRPWQSRAPWLSTVDSEPT